MEASLDPPWWQKLGLLGALVVCGVLAGATYVFDPPVLQPGALSGQVLDVTVTEQPKVGFGEIALVRLNSGEVIHATVSSYKRDVTPVGAKVTVYKSISLVFRKHSYRAEIIGLRPNKSFKPNPLRGSA